MRYRAKDDIFIDQRENRWVQDAMKVLSAL